MPGATKEREHLVHQRQRDQLVLGIEVEAGRVGDAVDRCASSAWWDESLGARVVKRMLSMCADNVRRVRRGPESVAPGLQIVSPDQGRKIAATPADTQ
jgi:hypothetical protein